MAIYNRQQQPKKIYIRVKAWWKTWANTIAYFPLEDDTLDVMGNYSFSESWTKETIWYTYGDKSNNVTITWTDTTVRFISYYAQLKSISAGNRFLWLINWWAMRYQLYSSATGSDRFVIYNDSDGRITSSEQTLNDWWNLFTYGVDSSGNYAAYLNGSLAMSGTVSQKIWTNYISTIVSMNLTATVSDVLLESAPRSAQEISDYYNDTKAIYWL